jgi:hypothetical protein
VTENLSWFSEQLELLRTHPHSPKVDVSLYVTRATTSESADSSSEGTDSPPLSPVGSDPEKSGTRIPASARRWPSLEQGDVQKDMECAIETRVEHSAAHEKDGASGDAPVTHTFFEYAVKAGRPDTASLIRGAVTTTPQNQRVLVAACGPDGLMHVVRDTTAKLIVGGGPAVELHCEQFGW